MSEHQLWNELGNIHMGAGEYDQAIGAYKKAVELSPQSGDAHLTLANAYIEVADPAKSTQYYQRAIELFEDFTKKAEAWQQLGAAYQDLHDYQNSLLAFERAVALDPENMLYQEELENILLTISEGMLEEVEEKQMAPQFQAEQEDFQSIHPSRQIWKDEANPKAIENSQGEIEAKTQSGEFFSDWFKSAISSFDKDSAQKTDEKNIPSSLEQEPEQTQTPSETTKDFASIAQEENPELDDSIMQLINSLSHEINTEISASTHNEEKAKWLIDDEYEDDTQETDAEALIGKSEAKPAKWLIDDEDDLQQDKQDLIDDSLLELEEPIMEERVADVDEQKLQGTDAIAQSIVKEIEPQIEEHLVEQEINEELVTAFRFDEVEESIPEAEALVEHPAHEIDTRAEGPLIAEEIVEEPVAVLGNNEVKENILETEVAAEPPVEVTETQVEETIIKQEAAEESVAIFNEDNEREENLPETEVVTKLPVEETQPHVEEPVAALDIDETKENIPETEAAAELFVKVSEAQAEEPIPQQEAEEEPAAMLSTYEDEENLSETEVAAELPAEEAQAQAEEPIAKQAVVEEPVAILSVDKKEENLLETVAVELPVEEAEAQTEGLEIREPDVQDKIAEEAVPATAAPPLSAKEILANANVWKQIGSVFFDAEIFDGAVVAFQKAIEINNTDGISLHNLAVLYAKRGEYEKAVGLYEESIAHLNSDEEKITSLNNLGNTYRAMRNYEASQEAYRQADELDLQKLILEKWISNEILGLQTA